MKRITTMYFGTRQTRARERREFISRVLGGLALMAAYYVIVCFVFSLGGN